MFNVGCRICGVSLACRIVEWFMLVIRPQVLGSKFAEKTAAAMAEGRGILYAMMWDIYLDD